jgi:hypothetical protein
MKPAPSAALAMSLLLLSALPACRTGKSMVDLGPDIESARATVSGSVRQGDGVLAGRTVEAVRVDGEGRVSATTNVSGGYTLQVPPGRWRLRLVTNEGEALRQQPGEMDLGNSEMETGVDFVVQ